MQWKFEGLVHRFLPQAEGQRSRCLTIVGDLQLVIGYVSVTFGVHAVGECLQRGQPGGKGLKVQAGRQQLSSKQPGRLVKREVSENSQPFGDRSGAPEPFIRGEDRDAGVSFFQDFPC